MLWLLFLGAQLENSCLPNGSFLHGKALSLFCFLITVLITGLVGNITQYIVGGGPNFGGMSGVIYGLMGYTWLMGKGFPYSGIGFPNSTFGAMLLLLVVMEIFAGSWIASGAHLGGLVTGLSCAGILITVYRIRN
jgi:GlpG protein